MANNIPLKKENDSVIISFESYFLEIFAADFLHYLLIEYYVPEVKGLTSKVFGLPTNDVIQPSSQPNFYDLVENEELYKIAEENFKASTRWNNCACLYQYAINGVDPHSGEYSNSEDTWFSLVEEVEIYFQTIHSDFSMVKDPVRIVVYLALLRFGMDGELDFSYFSCSPYDEAQLIAFMAGLDERTVKNAQAQGAFRGEDGDFEFQAIKLWLSTKKGFKKSKASGTKEMKLADIRSAQHFGTFLESQRLKLGKLFDLRIFPSKHYCFDKKTVEQLEQGIFNLPLNTIPVLAREYGLEEKEFLSCVMRIFFPNELAILKEQRNV